MFGVYARRRVSALGALLTVLVLGWHATEGHTATSVAMPTTTVLVAPGDTVWSLAERYGTGDPRADVDTLGRLNHLRGGQIQAGQTLRIPLFM